MLRSARRGKAAGVYSIASLQNRNENMTVRAARGIARIIIYQNSMAGLINIMNICFLIVILVLIWHKRRVCLQPADKKKTGAFILLPSHRRRMSLPGQHPLHDQAPEHALQLCRRAGDIRASAGGGRLPWPSAGVKTGPERHAAEGIWQGRSSLGAMKKTGIVR